MSAVATAEDETTVAGETEAERQWSRTKGQEAEIAAYLAMIDRMYPNAGPEMLAVLKDTTVLSTEDLVALFGYKRKTRVFQLYTDLRELAHAGQTPHPSAMPDADSTLGHRGARAIRGVMKGRLIHWALQSGRYWFDFTTGTLVQQEGINHGGAPRRS